MNFWFVPNLLFYFNFSVLSLLSNITLFLVKMYTICFVCHDKKKRRKGEKKREMKNQLVGLFKNKGFGLFGGIGFIISFDYLSVFITFWSA